MKKIAYIELDTHVEIAENFMELMNDSKEFSVDYYFSERVFKQVGKRDSHIFITENTELLNLLKQQKYDLVIIGTVHRYFNLFNEIAEKFNTSVIVHNLSFTKISKFQLFKNIFKKDFQYRLKLWLKEDLLSAPKVFEKAKNLLVLDESLMNDNLNFLPLFFTKNFSENKSEIFSIVIPGSVDQKRRDYKAILKKLEKFQTNTNFKFYFLGKAQNQELRWLQDFEKKKPKTISIQYFTEKVPATIFDEVMQNANLLWCPIQKETEFFSQKEVYGKTKMSGNIGDAIKYGKQAIFPNDFVSKYPFLIPEIDDVEKQILDVNNNSEYDFQEQFNKQKVAVTLEETLQSLI